jgi:hypothetical protein
MELVHEEINRAHVQEGDVAIRASSTKGVQETAYGYEPS